MAWNGNIKQHNRHNPLLRLNYDEYWDFFVNYDSFGSYNLSKGNSLNDSCLISYIDLCNSACTSGDTWLFSTDDYSWESGISISNTLYNISYTGLDNGLFTFKKDRISNKDFLELYQNNKYEILEDDYRLKLHAVSGSTGLYDYPLHIDECEAVLNGGFFQGFFKTECDKYQILPSKLEEGNNWEFEFKLKPCELEKESDKTLNDKYPDNKGIFFYIGTRAENKWVYLYKDDEAESGSCFTLSPDNYVEDAYIDKKDYIIGNFYGTNNVFPEEDTIDDYLNYKYFDPKYYVHTASTCDLDDYIEFEDDKPYTIDEENLPYTFVEDCCSNNTSSSYGVRYVNIFCCKSCGCSSGYRRKPITNSTDTSTKSCNFCLKDGDYWDDEYAIGFDDLDCDFDYIEPELDISDFDYLTDSGLSISGANQTTLFTTDNKFILFNRTCTGYNINTYEEGVQLEMYGRKQKFKDNLFILMNRTCTGYNINNIDSLRDKVNNEYDYSDFYSDIYNNALAFRITDNGEIGFRLLTYDCEISGDDKTSIIEGYSYTGVIEQCEWSYVHVKVIPSVDKMKMYFYVNGKLVYITSWLPKINLRELNEDYTKQEGVPYNISLGGGTQGLCETILPNYMLEPTRVYPLEQYFAGSFIGYISKFRWFNCNLEYNSIRNNYLFDKSGDE